MRQAENVVIVGAGPVGILNALGLARAGIEVTLLEREDDIVSAPRAMVYHWTVLEGLARLGILAAAEQAGFTKQDYAFRVYRTGEMIHYSLASLEGLTRFPYNLHLGQDRLARIGLAELRRLPNVRIRFGWDFAELRQDDTSVTAVSSGDDELPEVSGGWLIGADGASSAVRKALGLTFDGMTWGERFVATDIHYDFAALGYARTTMVVDAQHGAIVVQADPDGLWRYTFAEDLSLPEDGIEERTMQRLADDLPDGRSARIERLSPYRMHQRSAPAMRAGRVLLAGDAGHATNPTGGLGLTSGLFDTYALYPTLAAVIQGYAPDTLLDRYSDDRLRVFRELTSPAATENKRFVFNSDDPARLAVELDRLREQLSDPDQLLARLRFTESLMTPVTVGAAS